MYEPYVEEITDFLIFQIEYNVSISIYGLLLKGPPEG